MTIKFAKLLIPIISILSIFTIFTSLPTFAATDINACNGLDKESLAYRAAGCDNDTEDQLPKTIINILNIIIGISGIIAVIFIIIGGINYMTSSGDIAVGDLTISSFTVGASIVPGGNLSAVPDAGGGSGRRCEGNRSEGTAPRGGEGPVQGSGQPDPDSPGRRTGQPGPGEGRDYPGPGRGGPGL